MSDSKKERFRSGPENETFNLMKGKDVKVYVLGRIGTVGGTLAWVDVYTVGIRELPDQEIPTIIYKGPGVVIELDR